MLIYKARKLPRRQNEMTIRNGRKPKDFTQISNAVAQNLEIPLEAKGVWLYLVTQREDWAVVPKWLSKNMGIGIKKLYLLLNVLIKFKLCHRERKRKLHVSGRFVYGEMDYVIHGSPEEYDDFQKEFQTGEFDRVQNDRGQNRCNKQRLKLRKTKSVLPTSKENNSNRGPPDPQEKAPDGPVVVPPELLSVEGLKPESARLLVDLFGAQAVVDKIPLLEGSGGNQVRNVYGFLKKAVEEDWQITLSKDALAESNRKWALAQVHGGIISTPLGLYRIDACRHELEFCNSKITHPQTFAYNTPDFKEDVNLYIERLQELNRGPSKP